MTMQNNEKNLPPECLDDDPPQHCYDPAPQYCEVDARSARGYCPDDEEAALAEYCSVNTDASFCSGDSDEGHELLEEVAVPTDGEASSITHTLPEAGIDAMSIMLLALVLMWLGVAIFWIRTWSPR